VADDGLWRDVTVVPQTGSTNADLLEQARAGAAEGLVLVAEEQTAGRGRLGRTWSAPAGAALTFSVLLRPSGVPPARLGWLPLLTGVAVATAVRAQAGVPASLKWPNDVLVGERKLAGILAEAHGDAVVVGVGLNVTPRPAELPVPAATSLLIEGAASTDRTSLLAAILTELAQRYRTWRADPDAPGLRADYLRWSATVGREVRVELPGGARLSGTAEDVDEVGRLVVRTPDNLVRVGAGDVVHVR
jgi:BirA family transcriptional regulator, biotin operon repressor / biotin---[acetyl-CoA-carboxylase] ligase